MRPPLPSRAPTHSVGGACGSRAQPACADNPRAGSRRASGRSASCGTARGKVSKLAPLGYGKETDAARSESRLSCFSGDSTATPNVDRSAVLLLLKKSPRRPQVLSNGNTYVGALRDNQMHGKGLFTWHDGSQYDGEFKLGKMSGHGSRRWPDNRQYIGQWREDMMSGQGQMLWPSGESYKGEFRKGAFQGRGTRVWESGDKYVGDFSGGEQDGEGTFYSSDGGWVYQGLWLHGRMYGEGCIEWPDGTVYIGEWSDGIREGRGRLEWPDGSWYEGPFRGNDVEGYGRKVFADGSSYEGQFQDGEFEGQGTFRWQNGTEFEGLWRDSEIAGPGCHRLPDGSEIAGTFEDQGASGLGTKRWANGCVFEGALVHSLIDLSGTLKWPDGRCYVGEFDDDAMHGEGTLMWPDAGGTCTYKGQFANNLFEGTGLLEWSSGVRYEGEFLAGLYHGEGTFEWTGGVSKYRGQWVCGGMTGQGTLTHEVLDGEASDSYVYMGAFGNGHMEGQGHVTFGLSSGDCDEYKGDFKASRFSGLGTFTWGTGASLSGIFEDNYCNRVGRKEYPDGRIYTGELRFDLENGKGVMCEAGGSSMQAIWADGKVVKELLMARPQEFDMLVISGGKQGTPLSQAVANSDAVARSSSNGRRKLLLPVSDESGQLVDGKAQIVFLNGDRYIGHLQSGRKHGLGMYVYADLATYRGQWDEDVLDGVRHPVTEDSLPIEVRNLTDLKGIALSAEAGASDSNSDLQQIQEQEEENDGFAPSAPLGFGPRRGAGSPRAIHQTHDSAALGGPMDSQPCDTTRVPTPAVAPSRSATLQAQLLLGPLGPHSNSAERK